MTEVTLTDPVWWSRHPELIREALAEVHFVEAEERGDLLADPGTRLTMTVEQAAEVLGISRTLAYEAVRRGEIPSIRIGRRVLVPVARLESMLSAPDS